MYFKFTTVIFAALVLFPSTSRAVESSYDEQRLDKVLSTVSLKEVNRYRERYLRLANKLGQCSKGEHSLDNPFLATANNTSITFNVKGQNAIGMCVFNAQLYRKSYSCLMSEGHLQRLVSAMKKRHDDENSTGGISSEELSVLSQQCRQ
jgi:hypothetical protein